MQKFSPEVRTRAVRMVIEHRGDHASQWAAIVSIAAKMGCTAQTLTRAIELAPRPTNASGSRRWNARTASFARGPNAMMGYISTLINIQSAFDRAGVRFLDNEVAGGIGVRLAEPDR